MAMKRFLPRELMGYEPKVARFMFINAARGFLREITAGLFAVLLLHAVSEGRPEFLIPAIAESIIAYLVKKIWEDRRPLGGE